MKKQLAVSLLCLGLYGCGVGDAEDVAGLDQALSSGVLDTTRTWAVGVCQGPLNTDPARGPVGTCRSGTAKCSGTLVGPNLVLTARHCVRGIDYGPGALSGANPCDGAFNASDLRAGGLRITTDDSIFVGAPRWHEVSEVRVPQGNNMCTDDLALLVLADNVPVAEARPVGIDARRDLARRPVAEVAVVGRGSISDVYGLDMNGDWDGTLVSDRGDLLRRVQQHIPFVCAKNAPASCSVSSREVPFSHVFPVPNAWYVIGRGPGSGDSGSSIIESRRLDRRSRRVLGVNTWSFISADGTPAQNAGVRLDRHAAFLRSGVAYAAQVGGYGHGCDVDAEDAD